MDTVPFLAEMMRRSPMSVTHDDSGTLNFATSHPGVVVRAVADEKHRCVRLLCSIGVVRNIDDASLARRLLPLNVGAQEGKPYFSFVAASRRLYIGADLLVGSTTPEEAEQCMASLASRVIEERELLLDEVMSTQ